eukprot:Em0005g1053a
MVKAWYMDNAPDDQRLPHRPEGAPDLSLELLASLGVLYWKIDVDRCDEEGLLAKIKKDRGYTYQDIVEVCPEKLPNYAQKNCKTLNPSSNCFHSYKCYHSHMDSTCVPMFSQDMVLHSNRNIAIYIVEHPEKDLVEHPEKDLVEHPEKDFVEHPEKELVEHPEKDFVEHPEKDFVEHPEKELVEHPEKDFVEHPEKDFVEHPEKGLLPWASTPEF